MVYAQAIEAGATPLYLGKISDELDKSFAAVKEAMKKVDFLITTGGVSVGDFDFLPAIYENSERTCCLIKLPCARAA